MNTPPRPFILIPDNEATDAAFIEMLKRSGCDIQILLDKGHTLTYDQWKQQHANSNPGL